MQLEMDFKLEGIGMTSLRTRERMVDRLKEQGITDVSVLSVMRLIPRHIFLDEALSHRAYDDASLPIGHHQTLSQPYIVAKMTEMLLSNGKPNRVLEVGTGSGYQTSILAKCVDELYTVERIAPLMKQAYRRLQMLGVKNCRFAHTDGSAGWPDESMQFDAIMVTAAAEATPKALVDQLKEGGQMIIPMGKGRKQTLCLIKKKDGQVITESVEPVHFVPLKSGSLVA